MTEFKTQVAIIDHCRGQRRKGNKIYPGVKPFPKLFVCHVYQGRSKDEGFFLKMLGVWPGVADVLAIWKLPEGFDIAFLEVKTEKGYLSPSQKKFKGICHWFGIKYALVRSVTDAHNQLKAWGVEHVHDAIQEPDLRDDKQKRDDFFDMCKPL